MFINSKFMANIEICTLCGLSLQASIKMALKGNQFRFMAKATSWYDGMVKQKQHYAEVINEVKIEDEKKDNLDLDEDILDILKDERIDITCPNSKVSVPCKHVLNLGNMLKQYQEWMDILKKKKGNDNIETTVDIDMQCIDSTDLLLIILEAAEQVKQIKDEEVEKLRQFIMDIGIDGAQFQQMKKKDFAKKLKPTGIKIGIGGKLFNIVNEKALNYAQSQEMGQSFDAQQYDGLMEAYDHVLDVHINKGIRMRERVFLNIIAN